MASLTDLAKQFLSLTGYGGKQGQPQGQPIPVPGAKPPLPVATLIDPVTGLPIGQTGLPVAQALPPLPTAGFAPPQTINPLGDQPGFYANRYPAANTAAPINAVVTFESTWLERGRWVPDALPVGSTAQIGPNSLGSMYIRFQNYAEVRYDRVPLRYWQDLCNSPSHGKFHYQHVIRAPAVWAYPYALVAGASRKPPNRARRRR